MTLLVWYSRVFVIAEVLIQKGGRMGETKVKAVPKAMGGSRVAHREKVDVLQFQL